MIISIQLPDYIDFIHIKYDPLLHSSDTGLLLEPRIRTIVGVVDSYLESYATRNKTCQLAAII